MLSSSPFSHIADLEANQGDLHPLSLLPDLRFGRSALVHILLIEKTRDRGLSRVTKEHKKAGTIRVILGSLLLHSSDEGSITDPIQGHQASSTRDHLSFYTGPCNRKTRQLSEGPIKPRP